MSDFQIIENGFLPESSVQAESPVFGRAPQGKRDRDGLVSVLGADQRRRLTETTLVPWRMICALHIHTSSGETIVGTGWLVGPRTVLTAGHCIATRSHGAHSRIEVIAGRDGDTEPFGRVEVPAERMEAHPRWAEGFDADRDVGVLHLDRELGRELGWFATATAPDDALVGVLVNVAGYPYEVEVDEFGAPTSPHVVAGRELWWHADAIERIEGERIHYATDTSGGQSGGPVWTATDRGGMPIGLAVHAYGAPRASLPGGLSVPRANSAPRIDDELADRLSSWIGRSAALADIGAPGAPGRLPTEMGGPPEPLTEAELMRRVADPDTPWSEIEPFIELDETRSEPFAPRLRMTPLPGQDVPETAKGLDWLNRAIRVRRASYFRREAAARPNELRFVSDGDSWFMHPLIADTWNALFPGRLVFSLDGAGDLLSDIAGAADAIKQARRIGARGVLLSGGGNDVLAGGALSAVLSAGDGSDPASYLDTQAYGDRIRTAVNRLGGYARALVQSDPRLHVFLHGYDYARPMPGGKWLAGPMEGRVPGTLQAGVVAVMIDRLNDEISVLAASLGTRVHHVDLRGATSHPWRDEIHPNNNGFKVIADRWTQAIHRNIAE